MNIKYLYYSNQLLFVRDFVFAQQPCMLQGFQDQAVRLVNRRRIQ